jgi:hypothetical protein
LEPIHAPLNNEVLQTRLQNNRLILINQAPPGRMCGFIMEVVPIDRYHSHKELINAWNEKPRTLINGNLVVYHNLNGDILEFRYGETGVFTEALYDWGYGVTEQQVLPKSPPFLQPRWPSGEGFGRIPDFKVNGKSIQKNHPNAVYQGPLFSLQNSVLMIRDASGTYQVDYTEKVPEIDETR